MNRFPTFACRASILLALVGLWGGEKVFGDVSMNFNTLTTSSFINFSNLYSGSPPSESANLATYQTDTPDAWYGGNYVPDQFAITSFNGGSVLQMGISPSQFQTTGSSGTFTSNNLQGMRYDTKLSGATQKMSVDIYVSPSWTSTTIADFGMEAIGVDAHGNVVANSVIAYLNNDRPFRSESADPIVGYIDPGVYYYNDASGNLDWHFLAAVSTGFNTVGMTLTTRHGIQYTLNGVDVGSLYADTSTVSLSTAELYGRNYYVSNPAATSDQTFQFDNFSATGGTSVPVPSTAALFAGGLVILAVGAGGWRRRFVA